MSDAMTDTKWLDGVRGNESFREVSRRSGIPQGTLTRQLNANALTFESVRAISRAYDRPVLADLVATHHLAPEDVGVDSVDTVLRAASDERLVIELGRRLDVSPSTIFDAPISKAVKSATNIVQGQFGSDDGLDAVARVTDTEPTDEQ